TVVATFGESVLLAFERAEDFVVIGLAESLLRTGIATALVLMGYGIIAISLAIVFSRTAAAAAMTAVIRYRGVHLTRALDRPTLRALARDAPVVAAIPIVNAFFWRADTLLLTWMCGLTEVGYYSAATRILDITRSLPQAYARAAYPVLSRLRSDQPEEFR